MSPERALLTLLCAAYTTHAGLAWRAQRAATDPAGITEACVYAAGCAVGLASLLTLTWG